MRNEHPLTDRAYRAFFTAALINLMAEAMHSPLGVYMSKPLLMPTLALAFYLSAKPLGRYGQRILWGLGFSWGGDLLLMLVPTIGEGFFVFGVASFLIAHLCYISAFLDQAKSGTGYLKKNPWLVLPFLAYLVGLSAWWWDDLGTLRVPVLVYSAIITTMGLSALHLRGVVAPKAWTWLIGGALLFVASDSLLAINKFKWPLPMAGIWIMATYIAAQYAIAKASIDIDRPA
jgi:uncharacterized membrane protein YhhN